MRQSRTLVLFIVMAGAGCGAAPEAGREGVSGEGPSLAQVAQAVQRDPVNFYEYEAGGWINLLTTWSSPVYAVIRSPEGTCGATFISEHHAVTAAHCTSHAIIGGGMVLQRVLTPDLSLQEVLDASVVSGTSNPGSSPPSTIGSPSFSIADPLTGAEGYSVYTMLCGLRYRCSDGEPNGTWGERYCPMTGEEIDMALIECESRPAPRDWIAVHSGDPSAGDIWVTWFHEILDLQQRQGDTAAGNNVPANNWWNYGYYSSSEHLTDNYHYTDTSHEVLPLMSRHFHGGTAYKLLGNYPDGVRLKTDLPVCHGTSGAGTAHVGTSTLLGPVVTAHVGFTGRLCHDFQNTTPGTHYMSTLRAPKTRLLENTSDVLDDR